MTFLVYLQGFTIDKYSDLTPVWTRPETSQTKGKIGGKYALIRLNSGSDWSANIEYCLLLHMLFVTKNCTNIRKTVFHTMIYIAHVNKLYICIQFIVTESVLRRQVILRGLAQQKHFF